MESPFEYVYVVERCNVCGASYPLTLHELYLKQQVKAEWRSARPCPECDQQRERLVLGLPAEALKAAEEAWQALAQALAERGVAFYVAQPPPDPHASSQSRHS